MIESHEGREARQIRVETLRGGVEGFLHTSSVVRTLDEVNVVTGSFLTLHSPRSYSGEWKLDRGPLAISKSSTLFVMELSQPASRARRRADAVRFSRSPVRLWVNQVSVQGFVHVPPGGTAMSRLNQSGHDFMALTSVSVVGPNFEFATKRSRLGGRPLRLLVESSSFRGNEVSAWDARREISICAPHVPPPVRSDQS
jgi:hypothetical protein